MCTTFRTDCAPSSGNETEVFDGMTEALSALGLVPADVFVTSRFDGDFTDDPVRDALARCKARPPDLYLLKFRSVYSTDHDKLVADWKQMETLVDDGSVSERIWWRCTMFCCQFTRLP